MITPNQTDPEPWIDKDEDSGYDKSSNDNTDGEEYIDSEYW